MQADLFKCSLCSESYDLKLHIPKILISCPHCFCLKCLNNIYINHPPQERQCPTCSLSFISTINTPEDFPTDPTLIYLLQGPPKTNIENYTELDDRAQNNEREGLFHRDNVRKKLKTDQEIDDEQGGVRELVISQFIGMRKILYTPQNIETPLKVGRETLPNADSQKNMISGSTTAGKYHDETESVIREEESPEHPLAKIANRLQGIFDEAQEAIDRVSKMNEGEANQVLKEQIPKENIIFSSLSPENEEEEVEIKPLSLLQTNISEEFQDSDDENCLALKPKMMNKVIKTGDEIEEEFAAEEQKLIDQEIQEMDNQSMEKESAEEKEKLIEQEILEKEIQEMDNQSVEKEFAEGEEEEKLTEQEIQEMDNQSMEKEFAEEEEKLIEQDIQEILHQVMKIEEESKLKFDFSEIKNSKEIFDCFWSQDFWKKTQKNKIRHLEANFSSSFLTDQLFILFAQDFLAKIKNLKTLILNLMHSKISSEGLQTLSDQLMENQKKLQTFKLNCSQTSVGQKGIKSLDNGLRFSQRTLENIELIFDSIDVEGNEFLVSLSRIEKLKHLKLSFDSSRISNSFLSSLVFRLVFIKNLESLELNLNDTKVGEKNLMTLSISQKIRLKHFKLCLGGTFISDDYLLKFFRSLSSTSVVNQLETFELDLHCTELSNATFKVFYEEALSEMQNLKSLKLDLRRTKITDESLQNLIIPAHKLQSLALNLSENKIHASELQAFKENNNLMTLKNIDIKIEQTNVSNEDFFNDVEKAWRTKALPPLNESSSENASDAESHLDEELNPNNENKIDQKESDEKRRVYTELKKELVLHSSLKLNPSKMSTVYASRLIDKLEPKTYDNILIKILAKAPPLSNVAPEIEKWKQIIQAMINARLEKVSHKPEKKTKKKRNHENNGGKQKKNLTQRKQDDDDDDENLPCQVFSKSDPMEDQQLLSEVVLSLKWFKKYGKEISFRENLIEILKSMKTKNFVIFHEKLIDFLKGQIVYKSWKMPAEKNSLKYVMNWWYRYKRGDIELMNLWKNSL